MTKFAPSRWRRDVRREITLWVEGVLSRPSDHFGGLAPCPFALGCLRSDRLRVEFGDQFTVADQIHNWSDDVDLVIVVAEDWPHDQIEGWCEDRNPDFREKDLVSIPFVPGQTPESGQPEDEMGDWESILDEPYAMVFVQRLSGVNDAAAALETRGYYDRTTDEFRAYVARRKG